MTKHIITAFILVITHMSGISQCAITCISDFQVALDDTGSANVSVDDVLQSYTPGCDTNFVLIVGGPGLVLGSGLSDSVLLDCEALYATTYIIGDTISGTSCWGSISVTDPLGTCLDSLEVGEVSVSFNGSFRGPFIESATVNGQTLRHLGLDTYAVDSTALNAGLNTFTVNTQSSLNGVSSLDIVLISKFLYGSSTLSAVEAIRADADASGYIGTDDVFVLQEIVLGVNPPTPYVVTKAGAADGTVDPFDFTDLYELTHDRSDITAGGLTFDVYQPGDVNGTAGLWSGQDRVEVRSAYQATYTDQQVAAGEDVEVRLTLSSVDVAGCHLSLDQQDVDILDITVLDARESPVSVINDEQASIVYIPRSDQEEVVILVKLRTKTHGMLSELLRLDSDRPQEVVTANLNEMQLVLTATSPTSTIDETSDIDAIIVSPTILESSATITVPAATQSVEIYNIAGQLVTTLTGIDRTITITRDQLPSTGLYIVRAIGSYGQESARLIAK